MRQKKIQAIVNYAFIDGQNLYMGTTLGVSPWKIDLVKFCVYLKEKYLVQEAYYYIGYFQSKNEPLYKIIKEAGFNLVFREHNSKMKGIKKGNVDSDIIFDIMEKLYRKNNSYKIILVSGDGDYKKLVEFLIVENYFEKILFPNKKYASSLYKKMPQKYYDYLDGKDVMNKIKK